ncbi:aminotransferase class V-fold PLP-dependent enzyme [Pelagicoccus sp. SDUM812003]|uniref:aminotransferase class V-fold PLP-dependent enzyme n=1 Tax=Pelagicoccus sp. SDUM812003 TaxID=3041267 RepID=UPI00280F5D73|nr:aminotransferase class V-fold PLP-dependent enzyme [Pelagicoccus sp. SDUM812003]MDQ8203767.1 aminotransferase class V-fold PLP-dependent enzyme [Pelagicoccus sp. SDUM812003]
MERREFFKTAAIAGAASAVATPWARAKTSGGIGDYDRGGREAAELAQDEAFWMRVRRDFAPAPDFINLEYGYFCPAALPVLEAVEENGRMINARASYFMRREMRDELEETRSALAALAGVSSDEICLTRNTTESMNIVIQGLDYEKGDEIVYSDQDYGSMVQALKQKSEREGIALKQVAIPLHPKNDEEIVSAFEDAITSRTRLLHVTHFINLSGQVLPVRKICDMAHARGVEVLVDSAHGFAHVDYRIPDFDCDYLGTSLHKWLCSPVGMGMLYVRKDRIPHVWGLMGDVAREDGDIRKLERLGTRPYNHHIGMREAIRYHDAIGGEAKMQRLRYLNQYWTRRYRDHERVFLNTPDDPSRHGAIANVGIRGVDPGDLGDFLFDRYNILTAPIPNHPVVKGVRITPGLPTPLRHLDHLVAALDDAAQTL